MTIPPHPCPLPRGEREKALRRQSACRAVSSPLSRRACSRHCPYRQIIIPVDGIVSIPPWRFLAFLAQRFFSVSISASRRLCGCILVLGQERSPPVCSPGANCGAGARVSSPAAGGAGGAWGAGAAGAEGADAGVGGG